MDILTFIPEELMILVVATYLVGVLLKQTKFLKDNLIPLVLFAFAIIFSCVLQWSLSGMAMLQGVLCWGVAIGVNQTFKQATKVE